MTAIHPRPSYMISVGGRNITAIIEPRLINLTLTEERGVEADQIDIEIDDADNAVPIPRRGVLIQVYIGWAGEALVDKGTFVIDDVEHSGAPDKLIVRGRSADLRASLTTKKERSWHDTTVGAIVREIARRNRLTPVVAPELESVPVAHVDQTDESDINLLDRLAGVFDAIATVKSGRLLFMPAGKGRTVTGSAFDVVTLERQLGDAHRFNVADRDAYTGVRAYWHDVRAAEKQGVVASNDGVSNDTPGKTAATRPSANNIKTLRHTYQSRGAAARAAMSNWQRIQRELAEFSYTLAHGRPDLIPELPVVVRGFKPEIDGAGWIIRRATHCLHDSGLTTKLDLEVRGEDSENPEISDDTPDDLEPDADLE